MYLLGALFIMAQTSGPSEAERWVGPVLTSAISLAATYFGYLAGKDKLVYDSERKLEKAELARLTVESEKDKARLAAQELQIRDLLNKVAILEGKIKADEEADREAEERLAGSKPNRTKKPPAPGGGAPGA